jgi:ABC-type branched-subunit amino acid transport system substrate-binding protein
MRARRVTRRMSVFVGIAALLVTAGCGNQSVESAPIVADGQVRLFGTDGNMSDSFGDTLKEEPGVLAGMKGTTPLNPLSEDFKRRMRSIDPAMTDFTYSAEAYDAVVIEALAAESARAFDGASIARYVNSVTVGGTTCESVGACLDGLRAGRDIQYRGVSLKRSGFTDAGEPSTTSYGTLNFGRNNHIDPAKTEYVGAGDESEETKAPQPPMPGRGGAKPPGQLKIGGLLPHSGVIAYQGPPITAAIKLAINEVNEAGGVLGSPVLFIDGDDGGSADVASATVDVLVSKGVQAIVGPCCSGVSLKVLPKIVQNNIVMISMSATSDALTKADDKGLFFRTSPPDKLQAKALADIVMRDGAEKIFIVARDDAYGTGLQQGVQVDLSAAGIRPSSIRTATYKVKDKYDQGDLNAMFKPLAKQVKQFTPDAVVIIGFEESGLLVRSLKAEGITFRTS